MKYLRWWIWSLVVLFLFYDYFLRVSPSVMVDALMREFQVNATMVGTISAFYFYAYAPLQLPVGLLMDRFGAKRLLTFAMLICALGAFSFGMAHHITVAEMGRFLMGVGSAFAFIGMVYVCAHWFPLKQRAFLIGLGNSFGMLGAVVGEGPLSIVSERLGWRYTMSGFAGIGVIIAIIMYLSIRNTPPHQASKKLKKIQFHHVWVHFIEVISRGASWINAIGALLMFVVTVAFASLWAVPFLQYAHHISRDEAAFAASMVFVGWIVGGPFFGYLSDQLRHRKGIIIWAILINLALLLPLIYIPHIPAFWVFAMMLLIGIAQSAQLLSFSMAVDINRQEAKGTAIAFTNFLVALGGAISQPLVGFILDRFALVTPDRVFYTLRDFRIAMTVFPVCLVLSLIFYLFLRYKKHSNQKRRKPLVRKRRSV
ncbi:MAG: MFS transporter [Simkaniaceae bacterium]|nr:MFS transporter [Simkaniaceae bacterium]